MNVYFDDDDLDRLETDPSFTKGLSEAIVKSFRRRMQQIRSAVDERDLRAIKSLHFEKLQGQRQGQCSIRLNDQFRLVFALEGTGPDKIIRVISIEDYH